MRPTPGSHAEDLGAAGKYIGEQIAAATGTSADPHGYGRAVARELFPDVLPYVVGTPAAYGFAVFNGRTQADNAPEAMRSLVTNMAVPSGFTPRVNKDLRTRTSPTWCQPESAELLAGGYRASLRVRPHERRLLCFWRDCYSGHVGTAEVRAGQIRAHQIGTLQACALETGTSETGILQLAATEICPVSLHAIEVPMPELKAVQIRII